MFFIHVGGASGVDNIKYAVDLQLKLFPDRVKCYHITEHLT